MDEHIKMRLMNLAEQKYTDGIKPCNGDSDFSKCFSEREEYNELIFWFNSSDGSTHIVKESDLEK
jgi:hypothetical protein